LWKIELSFLEKDQLTEYIPESCPMGCRGGMGGGPRLCLWFLVKKNLKIYESPSGC
jgi:hypothetical protein